MNSIQEIWKRVLTLMEGDLTSTTINTWFDDTEAVSLDTDRLVLYTPTEFKRNFILSRYKPYIKKALKELFSVELEVDVVDARPAEPQPADPFFPGTEGYTFDTFVVGASNKFAYAAAKAIADAPGKPKGYNPLFIYGDSGLGKTHLLYAIAHAVHEKYPELNVIYIRGETFTNELIAAIRQGRNHEFKEKYRSADVFLMDDVQFIAGKESTQEEMFHTFNALFENGKQIVFTADRPPKDMLRLDERLKSRFVWGLSADILPPDYETRIAIIKNLLISRGYALPEPVLQYLADGITNNVRQIEGTVTKILAIQDLMGEPVDVPTVVKLVKEISRNESDFMPSPDVIVEEVAKFYNIPPHVITGTARTKDIVFTRQVAMYVTRRLTTLTLQEIGDYFKRDHTTVMHSLERIETLSKKSPETAEILKDIISNINARYE